MTPSLRPSPLAGWLLRALVSRADAEAILGDLSEEWARHVSKGRERVWSQLWLEWRVWRYLMALARVALTRSRRSARHVQRDAWRALRSAPGTTAGVLLILTLSISAATVTFSVVDTVVLRPLPFDAERELTVIEFPYTGAAWPSALVAPSQFRALSERVTALGSLAAVAQTSLPLNVGGELETIPSAYVTASLFEALRVRPLIGQTFTRDHEIKGNDRVAVIGYDLWQRRFGGDAGVVGRSVRVSLLKHVVGGVGHVDASLTILGVMPRGFTYPITATDRSEMWLPFVMPSEEQLGALQSLYLHVVGRLRPGASLEQARAQADAVAASLSQTDRDLYRTGQFAIAPLKETLVGDVRGWMVLVLSAVAAVMLIACVNVANLQLARATYRAHDLSVRASLGATRRHLMASLLTESLTLSLGAASLAIVVSVWGIHAARAALPAGLLRADQIGLDLRVLTSTISAAVAAGLLSGVVPAWQASREDLVALLKQGATTMSLGRRRWRASFVIAEVAFVSVLLVTATLIISSFIRVTRADLGFDRSNLLVVRSPALRGGTLADVLDQLQRVPGVTAVGASANGSPPLVEWGFGEGGVGDDFHLPDAPAGTPSVEAEFQLVSSGYFVAAGIPIVRGRAFDDSDVARRTAIVIDEAAAAALFGQRDPLGTDVIGGPGDARRTVVGIARHVRQRGPEQTSGPQVYFPASVTVSSSSEFVVRTSRPTAVVIPAIQAALESRRPAGRGPVEIRRIEDAFRHLTADRRFNAGLMSLFGVLAVVIGAAGMYGVMASVVAQQTRELGVRMALGATGGRIVAGVLEQAGRYLIAGLVLGLGTAWWASRSVTSVLFEIRPTDLRVYALVIGVMAAVGLLAACIPARRASQIDPLVTLRAE